MLNEIFKGMDNAAEMINENFLSGGVVERGSNDNGEYTKYASGLAIVYKDIFVESVERVNFTKPLPMNFKDGRVACVFFASDNAVREIENVKSLSAQVTNEGDEVRVVNPLRFKYADNMNAVLMMIGFWK